MAIKPHGFLSIFGGNLSEGNTPQNFLFVAESYFSAWVSLYKSDKYHGFINYGIPVVIPDEPKTLASEALVFLLVGARTHWKCPIGYFLGNKISAAIQKQLLIQALELASESGLRVWSITADGTSVNMSTFNLLGCKFGTSYETMTTKFKHPVEDY